MKADTLVYTMRHGRTDYNLEKRYAGTIDVPLNEMGIKDAHIARANMAEFQFDVVITSNLKRSIETGRIIAGETIPILQSDLCNERNFGVLEGRTWNEVHNLLPPVLFVKVGEDLHSINPMGGEPFEDVWYRAKKFHRFLLKNYNGSNILIISHGVFLQLFHGLIKNLNCIESLGFPYPSNLEVTHFRFRKNRLIEEKVVNLSETEQVQW